MRGDRSVQQWYIFAAVVSPLVMWLVPVTDLINSTLLLSMLWQDPRDVPQYRLNFNLWCAVKQEILCWLVWLGRSSHGHTYATISIYCIFAAFEISCLSIKPWQDFNNLINFSEFQFVMLSWTLTNCSNLKNCWLVYKKLIGFFCLTKLHFPNTWCFGFCSNWIIYVTNYFWRIRKICKSLLWNDFDIWKHSGRDYVCIHGVRGTR